MIIGILMDDYWDIDGWGVLKMVGWNHQPEELHCNWLVGQDHSWILSAKNNRTESYLAEGYEATNNELLFVAEQYK
jgi:hypothetical protein